MGYGGLVLRDIVLDDLGGSFVVERCLHTSTKRFQRTLEKPRRFEVIQKMSDDALTKDPKTGEPCRRVITGGSGGFITHGASIMAMNTKPKPRK